MNNMDTEQNEYEENDDELTDASENVHESKPEHPNFGKIIFLLCGIIMFGLSFGMPTGLSIFFLEWQNSFRSSRANTAAIHATCIGALNIGAVIPGVLMGRIGARATLLFGSFLATLGMVLSFFAVGVTHMIITTGILFGLGCSMLNLPVIPCVTRVFTTHQSLIIAALTFGSGVLNTGLPYIYSLLANEYSWRGACLIISAIALNASVPGLIISSIRRTSPTPQFEVSTSSQSLIESRESDLDMVLEKPKVKDALPPFPNRLIDAISHSSLQSTSMFGSQILTSRVVKIHTDSSFQIKEKEPVAQVQLSISNWKLDYPFLLDPLYIVLVVTASFCLSALYAFVTLLMDFSKVKGFEDKSTGVFFVFLIFLISMAGKICTGLLNLIPAFHSVYILAIYGFTSCTLLVVVDYVETYYSYCIVFVLMGYTIGGFAAIYPKCVLDMPTVNPDTYPLALGIVISAEGVFDMILPILAGYSVDQYGSYTLSLHVYGLLSAAVSFALITTFCLLQRRRVKG